MKTKILNALAENPNGLRLRDLAHATKSKALNLWNPLSELIAENKIREIVVNSFVTGETYYIFKIVKPL